MDWPVGERGTPLRYIARIDIADLPECSQRSLLPESGVLHFFAAGDWDWAPAEGGASDWSAPDDVTDCGHRIVFVPAGVETTVRDMPEILLKWHRDINGRQGTPTSTKLSFAAVHRAENDHRGILLSNGMLGWQHAWQQQPDELLDSSAGDPLVQLGSFEDNHGGAWYFTIRLSDLGGLQLDRAESSYDMD